MLTIISAVTILVIGQLIIKFIIDPIRELKRVIGEIAHALIFYADVISNPSVPSFATFEPTDRKQNNKRDDAQKTLRQLSSSLMACVHSIPFYERLESVKIVVAKKDIYLVHKELMGLSNSVHTGLPSSNRTRRENIKRLLRLRISI